ncbi:helix-hairpin-helix domain-containing protein [Clostridium beijerinckii]|uniref:ComEA family DNA-binding protein n=1 Tax=Clostridium beijerinckii TaxID=1520 RepID=UPI00156F5182|nr:helix-hairpin-helix domain-containing protein [Clostridium beijerinckii]NRT36491.1 DNA uptake protein ComE-like DNA-binding protein [Clostridium beijerinckii]NRT44078.1 DNA uptake protein ComE-like DNA-binding protein [Clostridium beijerinckii]NRZ21928.1 DNA uptake protein ComE-like DNA-binding protein [Clostridium beijerinckii]UYZ33722.1 helix-hairpin-helix domain-containing protein [Clostridium beijerinckii]
MKITEKGTRWEIIHSLWIIWSFIWLVNGVGIFLAGKRTRVQKWYRIGLIYTAVGWFTMIMGAELNKGNHNIVNSAIMMTFFITYVVCIIHSFSIRKEYLMRLEIMEKQKTEQIVANNLKEKIAREYGMNSDKGNYSPNNIEDRNQSNANILYNNQHINENKQTFNSQMNFNQNEQVYNREERINKETRIYSTENNSVKNDVSERKNEERLGTSRTEKLLDVNSCTEDELLQLPGVGIIEAKKAINFRNNNEFNSVDEFIQVLNIKPHFTEKIRSMLICNQIKKNESINNPNINTGRAGRMVDF